MAVVGLVRSNWVGITSHQPANSVKPPIAGSDRKTCRQVRLVVAAVNPNVLLPKGTAASGCCKGPSRAIRRCGPVGGLVTGHIPARGQSGAFSEPLYSVGWWSILRLGSV